MSFRLLLSSILVSGCATHYQLDVAASRPAETPRYVDVTCPSDAWRTSYDWRKRPDRHSRRSRLVRVSSRCVDAPAQAQASQVELDGKVRLELSGSVQGGGAAEPRMLEGFTFEDQDGSVDIRDTDGRPRTITQVQRIDYYRNAVIIRVASGAGFIVDPQAVLTVRWNVAAAKK
jgi:hypothetical protein